MRQSMHTQIPDLEIFQNVKKNFDVTCGTALKPQAQVLPVSGLGMDRIPRSKEREHHLLQLHVGHTAANTREVLHYEGHIVLHLGNMIEKRRNLVTD
jgi:hypothetical protein